MADIVKMSVEARPGVGKGAARAARRAGYVPGVIYGGGKDPTTIQIKGNELLKTLQAGGFFTRLFDITVEGGDKHRVIPKDIQKNKLNGLPTHVDFLRLRKGDSITVEIPVEFLNEEACPGIEEGGVLNVVRHVVEVNVPADAIPDVIPVDLTGFNVGDSINISNATLPEGASPTITDRDFTIATIAVPRSMVEEDEETEDADGETDAEADGETADGEASDESGEDSDGDNKDS